GIRDDLVTGVQTCALPICCISTTLSIREDGGECLWVYNVEVLDEESVVEMQQGFTAFLQGIVADPMLPVAQLPLLTKAEQYRLRSEERRVGKECSTLRERR